MEDMSDSLFLDPFRVPSTGGAQDPSFVSPPQDPADATETVPGEVVDSAASSGMVDRSVGVATPLDLVDAVAALLEDIHLWWPRELKATDRDGHVSFAEGQILEEGSDEGLHRWSAVHQASDSALELDWFGWEPAESMAGQGAVPASSRATRVHLSWQAGESGGSELRARASEPGRWVEQWTALLGSFARFTGGRVLLATEGPDVAPEGEVRT